MGVYIAHYVAKKLDISLNLNVPWILDQKKCY